MIEEVTKNLFHLIKASRKYLIFNKNVFVEKYPPPNSSILSPDGLLLSL
jgi:hypothetical protein